MAKAGCGSRRRAGEPGTFQVAVHGEVQLAHVVRDPDPGGDLGVPRYGRIHLRPPARCMLVLEHERATVCNLPRLKHQTAHFDRTILVEVLVIDELWGIVHAIIGDMLSQLPWIHRQQINTGSFLAVPS